MSITTTITTTQFEHWIGGRPVPPTSGRHLDSISPHDGEVVLRIADSSAEDVERAVIAAHQAQPAWGRTTTAERSRVLTSIAAGIREGIDALVELECAEGGKLPAPARTELLIAADYFDYYGAIVRTLAGDRGVRAGTVAPSAPCGALELGQSAEDQATDVALSGVGVPDLGSTPQRVNAQVIHNVGGRGGNRTRVTRFAGLSVLVRA